MGLWGSIIQFMLGVTALVQFRGPANFFGKRSAKFKNRQILYPGVFDGADSKSDIRFTI